MGKATIEAYLLSNYEIHGNAWLWWSWCAQSLGLG